MNAGDTLLIDLPGTSLDSHLWMVISDPSQNDKCVLVNLTSWRADKDQSCVLKRGDHPNISRDSCVNYRRSKCEKVEDLQSFIDSGRIKKLAPLAVEVLKKIRDAVGNSMMPMDHAQLLIDQGLIELGLE